MAFETWVVAASLNGTATSGSVAVPSNAVGVTARLDSVAFLSASQRVDFRFECSWDGGANWSSYGGVVWFGGSTSTPREFGIGFNPGQRPTHARGRLETNGLIVCGLSGEFPTG